MIRFIDLTDQICDGEREFAWFDTITDRFLEFSTFQTWDNWKDFASDYLDDIDENPSFEELERFRTLYPWEDKDE